VEYFLHLVCLNASRLLPRLSGATRCALFAHAPAVFDSQLIATLRRIAIAYTPSTIHQHAQLMDTELRALFGIEAAEGTGAHAPVLPSKSGPAVAASPARSSPAPAGSPGSTGPQPVLSPFLQFRSVAGANAALALPTIAWRHSAPLALYRHALNVVNRLVVETNSEVCLHVLHWLSCAFKHCQRSESSPSGHAKLHPTPELRALVAELIAPACSLPALSRIATLIRNPAGTESIRDEPAAAADGTEEKTNTADACSGVQHKRAVWLLLVQHSQWIDFAFALFAVPHLDQQRLQAAYELLSFALAPTDAPLACSLRDTLSFSKQALGALSPAVDEVIARIERDYGENEELHLRVSCLILPLLAEPSITPMLKSMLHLTASPGSTPPLPQVTRVSLHVFTTVMRWTRGALVALAGPANPSAPLSLSSLAHASATLAYALRDMQKLTMGKGIDGRATTKELYSRLQQVHGASQAAKKASPV